MKELEQEIVKIRKSNSDHQTCLLRPMSGTSELKSTPPPSVIVTAMAPLPPLLPAVVAVSVPDA